MSDLSFHIRPALPFRLDMTAWLLRRRPANMVDRWDGRAYRRILALPEGPVEICVTQENDPDKPLHVMVRGERGSELKAEAEALLERMLGLDADLSPFYALACRDRRLRALARRCRGMKPVRFPSVFEALVNAFACQQVSLDLGVLLISRLAAAFGDACPGGEGTARSFPPPHALAGARVEDLRELGFSSRKAGFIIGLARGIAAGETDVEGLAALDDRGALERLTRMPGVGRWSAEYVLLRGLGRLHIFPGDDAAARKRLKALLSGKREISYAVAGRILGKWAPWQGVVYFHLLLASLLEGGYGIEAPAPDKNGECAGRM